MMVRGGITKDGLPKSKVYPCRICGLIVRLIQFCVPNVTSRSTEDVLT